MEFILLCILASLWVKNLGIAKNITMPKSMNNIKHKLMEIQSTMDYINRNEEFCKIQSFDHSKKIYCKLYEIQKTFTSPEEQLQRMSLFLVENKHPIHNIVRIKHAVLSEEDYELDENEPDGNDNEVGRYEYDPRDT